MTGVVEDVVHFVSLGYGELRIAKKYATKDILERLFQTDGGIIVVDSEGDEVEVDEPDQPYDIDVTKTYTIVSEADLLSDTEDDEDELQDGQDDEDDLEGEEYNDEDNELINEQVEDEEEEDENVNNNNNKEKQQEEEGKKSNETTDTQIHNHEHHAHDKTNCCGGSDENQHNHCHHEEKEENHKSCDSTHQHDQQQKGGCCDHDHGHIETNNNVNNGFNKLLKMREERIKMISELYKPLYPEIFKLHDDLFDPEFLSAIKDYKQGGCKDQSILLRPLTKLTDTRIFSFKIFTNDFCSKLNKEIDNFRDSGLPTARPNSMNNYGVILDEIGFTQFFTELRDNYLSFYTSALYPDYSGKQIDSHHAFIVQYKMDKEKELGFHFDESDVTINLCLGDIFTGGSLYFKGLLEHEDTHSENFVYDHVPGTALIHIGHHRHGAKGITSGDRTNLILWLRNTGGHSSSASQ